MMKIIELQTDDGYAAFGLVAMDVDQDERLRHLMSALFAGVPVALSYSRRVGNDRHSVMLWLNESNRPAPLVVDLPMYPRQCSQNGSHSIRGRMSAQMQLRDWAMVAAKEAMNKAGMAPPRWAACCVDIDAYYAVRRVRDEPNIIGALKGAFDGLTLAGVWLDDSGVRVGEVRERIDATRPRIELRVTPLQ